MNLAQLMNPILAYEDRHESRLADLPVRGVIFHRLSDTDEETCSTRSIVLELLRSAKEPVSQSDVRRAAGMTSSAANQMLGRMVRAGVVERVGVLYASRYRIARR